MPFITESVAEIPRSRAKPIGFWWGGAQVWIDNDLKIVQGSLSPGQGCVAEAPWASANASDVLPLLFNLTADHTESVDLKESSGLAPRFAQMQQVSATACQATAVLFSRVVSSSRRRRVCCRSLRRGLRASAARPRSSRSARARRRPRTRRPPGPRRRPPPTARSAKGSAASAATSTSTRRPARRSAAGSASRTRPARSRSLRKGTRRAGRATSRRRARRATRSAATGPAARGRKRRSYNG